MESQRGMQQRRRKAERFEGLVDIPRPTSQSDDKRILSIHTSPAVLLYAMGVPRVDTHRALVYLVSLCTNSTQQRPCAIHKQVRRLQAARTRRQLEHLGQQTNRWEAADQGRYVVARLVHVAAPLSQQEIMIMIISRQRDFRHQTGQQRQQQQHGRLPRS